MNSRDDQLTSCLETELERHFGQRRRIADLKRRRSEYCTSCSIEELQVRFEDETTLNLLFKDLSVAALAPEARRIRPDFVYDPAREISVYRNLLAGAGLGTAMCYGSRLEPEADRYWLFLEKVGGVELYQVGEIATWQAAAAWLARMHVTMHAAAFDQAEGNHLRKLDRDGCIRWMERARDFVSHRAGSSPAIARRIDWIANRYGRVIDRLLALPATLIHGEFYASNVLVETLPSAGSELTRAASEAGTGISGAVSSEGEPARGSGFQPDSLSVGRDGRPSYGQAQVALRVCPVDWETAAIAPGSIDLAALTAGKWSDEHRDALVSAYRESWVVQGGSPDGAPTPESLNCCRLFLAVQWMGWAADWAPPQEHSNDWLGEALELAARLKL